MMETYGYMGQILTVNLTAGTAKREDLPRDLAINFLGGKGFGAKFLYDKLRTDVNPLSPENTILFCNAPLTGTMAPGSSRVVMSTKSPETGLWLDSNCGGFFGPELKKAGYDIFIIEGKSEEPVYILIENERVQIKSAKDLWGLDTIESTEKLKDRYGSRYMVACIGPAGEKLAPIASIISEYRAFGRGGGGAVMGSKNLKAIVVKGTKDIKIYDPDKFMKILAEAYNELGISPDTGGGRRKYGTNIILSFMNEAGIHPVRNFTSGVFEGSNKINEQELVDNYYIKNKACFSCPISCSKISKVKEGKYKDKFTEGPEYENTWAFGAQCGISDMGAIIHAEFLCDKLGIDAISAGNITGFAMECYQKGNLSEKSIGFSLEFGDDQAMIRFIELMGNRQGIGYLFSCGVAQAAIEIKMGSEHFAMHVKGMELPAYDPRGAKGIGLAYATSDRGGCHLRSWPVATEILSPAGDMDPLGIEKKPELVKTEQDLYSVIDSSGVCLFAATGISLKYLVRLLQAATGISDFGSMIKVMEIGERIYNLTRLFNTREGADRALDTLPPRLLKEPMPDGPARGQVVELDPMLDDYYLIRGWSELGVPLDTTLARLKLK